jgi:hypothetical protein
MYRRELLIPEKHHQVLQPHPANLIGLTLGKLAE